MQVTEGYIGPFSSIKVPIIFSPVTPGTVQSRFQVMFKNQQCPTVSVLSPARLPGRPAPRHAAARLHTQAAGGGTDSWHP